MRRFLRRFLLLELLLLALILLALALFRGDDDRKDLIDANRRLLERFARHRVAELLERDLALLASLVNPGDLDRWAYQAAMVRRHFASAYEVPAGRKGDALPPLRRRIDLDRLRRSDRRLAEIFRLLQRIPAAEVLQNDPDSTEWKEQERWKRGASAFGRHFLVELMARRLERIGPDAEIEIKSIGPAAAKSPALRAAVLVRSGSRRTVLRWYQRRLYRRKFGWFLDPRPPEFRESSRPRSSSSARKGPAPRK